MTISSRFLFSAAMDVTPDREKLFHEVYDTEHIPLILQVPGVVSATRWAIQPFSMVLGGERKTMDRRGRRASTRSTSWRARTSCSARRSPRPSTRAAGPARCARTRATAAT